MGFATATVLCPDHTRLCASADRRFCHGRQHALPHALPVQTALLEHGIGVLGGLQVGVLAVLADQDAGGAVDVEVGGH